MWNPPRARRPPGRLPEQLQPAELGGGLDLSLLTTLLGLKADATRGRLRIAPLATRLYGRLEVTGLHFAGHRLDFAVEGVRVKLGRVPRGIKVVTPG